MLSSISLLRGLLSAVSAVIRFVDKRQLIRAGEAQAALRGLEEARNQVHAIQKDRRALDPGSRKRLRDRFRSPD